MRFSMEKENKLDSVGSILRFWRKLKKVSQLDLALDVNVSSRHISFIETGKSRPSRDLILKITQSLKLPLRHRNAFLSAAGYAPEYVEEPLNGQKMEIIRQALQRMLDQHEPYPAFVINNGYKILMTNTGFDQFIKFYLGKNIPQKNYNVFKILYDKDGLRQYIRDWPKMEHILLARLWEEAVTTQNDDLITLYKEMEERKDKESSIDFQFDHNLPVLSFALEKNSKKASFFTTVTTLGSPLDLTTQELRIESLFPADEKTKQMFPLEIH